MRNLLEIDRRAPELAAQLEAKRSHDVRDELEGRAAAVLWCDGCAARLQLTLDGPGARTVKAPVIAGLLAMAVGLGWAGCESTAPAGAVHLCPRCR